MNSRCSCLGLLRPGTTGFWYSACVLVEDAFCKFLPQNGWCSSLSPESNEIPRAELWEDADWEERCLMGLQAISSSPVARTNILKISSGVRAALNLWWYPLS